MRDLVIDEIVDLFESGYFGSTHCSPRFSDVERVMTEVEDEIEETPEFDKLSSKGRRQRRRGHHIQAIRFKYSQKLIIELIKLSDEELLRQLAACHCERYR